MTDVRPGGKGAPRVSRRRRSPGGRRGRRRPWPLWVLGDSLLILGFWGVLFAGPVGERPTPPADDRRLESLARPGLLGLSPITVPPRTTTGSARVDTSGAATPAGVDQDRLARALARADELAPLSSLIVKQGDDVVVERYYRGMRAGRTTNLKSVSKTLLSPLVGIAIDEGLLEGPEQPLRELLPDYYERLPADDRDGVAKRDLTLHHLLSMTSGIESTSFGNYGAWVSSRDWVWDQLRRPMVCRPGCFEYSTGSTHLLSAILTRRTGESLKAYAERSFFGPLGIRLPEWDRDRQGRYLGGNNMALTPRQLLRVGEVFLDGGRWEGRQLVPRDWIELSWRPRATSPWNGHRYGYLWWSDRWGGHTAHFAWGYGGQYLVIVPSLDLVAVVTSSLARTQRGHTRRLRDFFDEYLIPAFSEG